MSSPHAGTVAAPSPWWIRIRDQWRSLPWRLRIHAVLLVLVTGGAIAHQAILWDWYVEDAAISFAFARNLADGEGLVPFVGGERVEGYSNPTWVFLLAFFELLGAESEIAARWIQAVLAGLTVPVVYLLGREAAPKEHSDVPILAAILLAGNAQFAIWGSSGLENGLFNLFLALGLWRLAVEARTGSWPWSAFWFFLLAISRPEAILYGAVGGFCGLVFTLHARRGLMPVVKWLATFFVPFFGYHAWRYSYFAWAWPNTYYAKLGEHRDPKPLQWDRAGWKYVRNWAKDVGTGFFLPVYVLGITGGKGRRGLLGIGVSAAVALTILLPSTEPDLQRLLLPVVLAVTYTAFYVSVRWQSGRPHPAVVWAGLLLVAGFVGAAEYMRSQGAETQVPQIEWLKNAPPYAIAAAFVILALAGSRDRGWQARLACWGTGAVAVFFACYALGDWMAGFRWMSMLSVPGSILLACGAVAVGDVAQTLLGRVEGRWTIPGWLATLAVVGAAIPPNVEHTLWLEDHPVTSPYSVKRRVEYVEGIQERLHLYDRLVDLDVDQGAHLYWSDFRMLDIAGLVDVPMAQHKFQRPFIREYLFEENRPHFAHVHGGWAGSSRIPTHPEWRRDYFEIPGYPANRAQFHVGNHIRRDLVMGPWPEAGPDRKVVFERDIVLAGWDLPSPQAAQGRRFYVEADWGSARRRQKEGEDFRVLLFVSGPGGFASWDLPMGYDWLPPGEWKPSEVFQGRFSPELPDALPVGTYEIGFVVMGPDGAVIPVSGTLPDGAVIGGVPGAGGEIVPARVAVGEVRFADALEIVPPEALVAEANADRDEALRLAGEGACEEAEHTWWLARVHHPRAKLWASQVLPRVARALSDCWVEAATAEEGDDAAVVADLEKAREWDHRNPRLLAAADPVADRLHAVGLEARAAEDWETAYRAFADVMRVDPSRAWSRRYAEEARAFRLGIDPESRAKEEAERKAKQEEVERRREEARQRAAGAAGEEAGGDDDDAPAEDADGARSVEGGAGGEGDAQGADGG